MRFYDVWGENMDTIQQRIDFMDINMLDEYCSRLADEKICITDDYEFAKAIDSVMEGNTYLSRIPIEKRIIKSGNQKYFCYYPLTSNQKFDFVYDLTGFLRVVLDTDDNAKLKQLYRGHGNWIFDMIPGIYRKPNRNILQYESQYIHEMISSYPNFFSDCKTALDYLVVLQHYSFPTRLLDFTENPLVALYMACASEKSDFADVIIVKIKPTEFKYYDSDSISLLANMAFADDRIDVSDYSFIDYYHSYEEDKTNKEYKGHYNSLIQQFNDRDDITRFLHLVRGEKPYFKAKIKPEHFDNAVLWVKAKQDFQRIINQSGVFAIFGINRSKRNMIDFSYSKYDMFHILIPPESKEKILQELDKIHINQATLYCDMDRIASFHVEKFRSAIKEGDNSDV